MGAAHATRTFPGFVAEVERCWYDTSRWASWVDGLDRVVATAGSWPQVGGGVTWESGPAGRGRVAERVVAYGPGEGQAVDVSDDSVTGRQTVAFAVVPAGVQVTLELEYRLHRRSPLTPVLDALFIRRHMTRSLDRTLARFEACLRAGRGPAGLL
jgi:Polyketide cyclase / dehydrase and lipid transport